MNESEQKPSADAAAKLRRSSDTVLDVAPVAVAEDDPERLFAELRAGKRSIHSLAPLIPLNIAFLWQAQRRISDEEFADLMADLEIQEVVIADLPTHQTAAPDAGQQRDAAVIAAFHARMAGFDQVSLQEVIAEGDMKPVLLAKTPLVDGVGFQMNFARGTDDSPAKPGTAPQLTVLCRAYVASSTPSTVKCEAVFSGAGLDHDLYCRVIVPLPIYKAGRRRLLNVILDNETRQPVRLPAAVGELFQEKNLFDLRLLKKPGASPSGIGSAVKGAMGLLFKRS